VYLPIILSTCASLSRPGEIYKVPTAICPLSAKREIAVSLALQTEIEAIKLGELWPLVDEINLHAFNYKLWTIRDKTRSPASSVCRVYGGIWASRNGQQPCNCLVLMILPRRSRRRGRGFVATTFVAQLNVCMILILMMPQMMPRLPDTRIRPRDARYQMPEIPGVQVPGTGRGDILISDWLWWPSK